MEASGLGVSRTWRGVAAALLGACGLSAGFNAPLHAQPASPTTPEPHASLPSSPVSASGASSAAPKLDLRLGAAQRPTQAWRLFVPDPNALNTVPPRSPDDPQPPPGAYRTRIGEPGRIF